MPPYTDNPLGAFLQTIGAGIPALAQGHRVRGIQDEQLNVQRQLDAMKIQQLETAQAEHPQDRAFEQFTRASSVDPLGSVVLQRPLLEKAGINLPEGYVPPDKIAALQRQKMIDQIMQGGGGPQGGPQAAGPGGANGPVDARTRIAYKLAFPNMDLTDIFGPANEPTVQVDTVQDGVPGKLVGGRSQMVGKFFPASPTGAQREKANDADQGIALLDKLEQQMADPQMQGYIGPAAGRWNTLQQVIPGFKGDPTFAALNTDIATLKNATVRAITGAQMNKDETPRILAQIPTEMDKPEVFMAKLKVARENLQMLRNRIYQIQGGTPPLPTAGAQPPQAGAGVDPRLVKYAQMKGLPLDQVVAAAAALK
jgi:hypothetical protein